MSAKTTNGVKGTPQDKKQTKLIQGKSGSVIAASRGKRKLDFDSQRFKGKTMFLDLAGYRRTPEIEHELTERGATIEKFFHRGVKYLVTNRSKKEGQSTPSPHTPGTAHSVGKSSWSQLVSPMTDSPSGTDMRSKQQPPAYQTRAQKLLQMSLEKQKNTGKKVDIVAMATGWGCKVVQLEELLAELRRLKPLPKKEESQMTTHGGRQARVRQLHTPFFKVEDLSRCYRPLVCEMKEWPRPDPLCSPKACPFDSPRRAKALQHATRHPQASPDNPYAHVQLHHSPAHLEEKRPGYCECCAQRYDDLRKHLKSTRHQEYASNPANFASLDSLIEQGTSFAAFIAGVKRKHEHQQREQQSLTPAKRNSPAKRRKTTSCKSPRKQFSKVSSNLASPAKPSEEVVLISLPSSPIKCNNTTDYSSCTATTHPQHATSPCSMATPIATLRSPRTPNRMRPTSPLKRSPGKIITLPQNVSKKNFSPKQGELCIVPFEPASTSQHSRESVSHLSAFLLHDVNKHFGNHTSATGSSDFLGFSSSAIERALPTTKTLLQSPFQNISPKKTKSPLKGKEEVSPRSTEGVVTRSMTRSCDAADVETIPARPRRNLKTIDEIAMWLQDKVHFEAWGEGVVKRVRRKRPLEVLVEDSSSNTPPKKRRLLGSSPQKPVSSSPVGLRQSPRLRKRRLVISSEDTITT